MRGLTQHSGSTDLALDLPSPSLLPRAPQHSPPLPFPPLPLLLLSVPSPTLSPFPASVFPVSIFPLLTGLSPPSASPAHFPSMSTPSVSLVSVFLPLTLPRTHQAALFPSARTPPALFSTGHAFPHPSPRVTQEQSLDHDLSSFPPCLPLAPTQTPTHPQAGTHSHTVQTQGTLTPRTVGLLCLAQTMVPWPSFHSGLCSAPSPPQVNSHPSL